MLWGRVAKYVLWQPEEKRKATGWRPAFGGNLDDEYLFRGMMWADSSWLFSVVKEKLVFMVNDTVEELLDFGTRGQAGVVMGGRALAKKRM